MFNKGTGAGSVNDGNMGIELLPFTPKAMVTYAL